MISIRSFFGIALVAAALAPLPAFAQEAPSSAVIAPADAPLALPSVSPALQSWITTGDVLNVQRDVLDGVAQQTVRIHIADSSRSRDAARRDITVVVPETGRGGITVEPGQSVVVELTQDASGTLQARVLDRTHGGLWIALALAFVLILVVGRRAGAASIATLLGAMVLTTFFLAPLVLRGTPPILAALLTAFAFAGLVAVIVFGWTRAAAAVLLGTALSTLLSTLVTWGLLSLANVMQLASPLTDALAGMPGLKLGSLILAVSILSTSGAILHCATRITAMIFLERRQHPDRGLHVLLDTGMTHGRRVLPAIAETALWATLGLGLPLLIAAGARVSVFRATLFGDVALLAVLPAILIACVALSIPIITASAAVLATNSRA